MEEGRRERVREETGVVGVEILGRWELGRTSQAEPTHGGHWLLGCGPWGATMTLPDRTAQGWLSGASGVMGEDTSAPLGS